jgi:hemin uptake protein HemP
VIADDLRLAVHESLSRRAEAIVPAASEPIANAARRRRVTSDTLFQGTRELIIVHMGREYVLRITRLGKLILTA